MLLWEWKKIRLNHRHSTKEQKQAPSYVIRPLIFSQRNQELVLSTVILHSSTFRGIYLKGKWFNAIFGALLAFKQHFLMRSPGKSDATWEVHPVHHRGISTSAFILFRKINGNAELWLIYTEENSQSNLCCPVPAPSHLVLEASAETAMAQDTTAIPPCTSLSAQSNPKFKPSANTSSKNLTGHLQEVSPKGLYVCIDISRPNLRT